jgi:DnaJ family protein C protein 3
MGDVSKAILDINALAKLIPDNTKAYLSLSELHYSMGEAELALNDVRECLRLDADHKKCSDFYKSLRKLNKLLEKMRKAHDENNFNECISAAKSVMGHDAKSASFKLKGEQFLCTCNAKAKNTKEAIDSCSNVLKVSPNDADAFYYRAQAYIVDELLDKAKSDCQKAHELESSQRTQECMEKINKLIKQSKKRDYYKILGVKRSADKNTIMKAYRKLAHKWHPDKYDGDEKEKAQKVFIDIAAAKEVLTDPGKRRFL